MGPGPGMGTGPGMQEIAYHYCENCEHVLPKDFKAGQRCPGCRRKISFMENADHTFTNSERRAEAIDEVLRILAARLGS